MQLRMQHGFLFRASVLLSIGWGTAWAKTVLPPLQYSTSLHTIKSLEGSNQRAGRATKRLLFACCEIPLRVLRVEGSDNIVQTSRGPSLFKRALAQLEAEGRSGELSAIDVVGHEGCKHLGNAIKGADKKVLQAIESYMPDFSELVTTAQGLSTYAKENPKTTLGGIWLSSKTTDLGKALLETAYPRSSPHWGIRVPPEKLEDALGRGIAVANVYWLGNAVTAWATKTGWGPLTVSSGLWRKAQAPDTIDVYHQQWVDPIGGDGR